MNRRTVGFVWEERAAEYLKNNGITILEKNYKVYRRGEIDLIGKDKNGTLIFFEVKYRKSNLNGLAAEAVTYAKRKSICQAADYYRFKNSYEYSTPIRFDVIGITSKELIWYKNAFDYVGRG